MKSYGAQIIALGVKRGNTVMLDQTRRVLARVEKFAGDM